MKQTRNKVPSNIFRGFDVKAKVQFVFFRENDIMKSKYYVLAIINKEMTCAWCI